MSALLEARGVTVRRGGRAIVDGVDLTLAAGELLVVVGPNGAGKSTLLRVLCGELVPDSGTVAIDGTLIGALPAWKLAGLRAVMPQSAALAFPFTVREVAGFGADGVGRGLDRRARAAITTAALERADIAHLSHRLYQTLSGGERQRVHFARALAQIAVGATIAPRRVLFLDEPTASLDLHHQLALVAQARALADEGLAVLVILHDLQLAADLADTLVLLDGGRLVAKGPPREVLAPER